MRRTVILLASTALAVLLSCGAALALNAVSCEGGGIRCVGTDRADLIRGSDDLDAIYGRDGGDILKGRGEGDALLGHKGDDELLGGPRQDLMIGGVGDDGLRGGDALDIYYFERPDWGQDAIRDASPRNLVRLPDGEDFAGAITTNMSSDSGPLPEVANAEGGSTVDWKGDVVAVVVGSTGDDTITGNDAANLIFDGEELDTDLDTVTGAGGNDLLDVQDGAADDKVACGEGHDTVYFDQELEMVAPNECEEQNPIPNSAQGERWAATFGLGSPVMAPAGVLGDE
jgi:peroxidase